jgi:predicted phosphodiesterase
MKLLEKKIPATCQIVLWGDSHEGNVAKHDKGVEKIKDWVKAKRNRYWVHMGDECDSITTDDKRYAFDPMQQDPIPLQQSKNVVKELEAIKGRGIVMLNGNHNQKLARFGNLTRDIVCERLGIPYGTWSCKVRLVTSDGEGGVRQVCKMFLTHGIGGTLKSNAKDEEQRRANMQAALKRKLLNKAADCLIMAMGHTHKLITVPPSKKLLVVDDGEVIKQQYLGQGDGAADYIEPDRRWYVNTGSLVKLYQMGTETYAERAGYDPIEMGYVVIDIQGGVVKDIRKVRL